MTHSTLRLLASCVLAGALAPSIASANSWLLTYEAAGVGATTATLSGGGVENFDNRYPGTYLQLASAFGGSQIAGTYRNVVIGRGPNWGFDNSQHTFADYQTGYSLALSQSVNYFGYWLGAADSANVVTFFRGSQQVGSFEVGKLLTAAVQGEAGYWGLSPSPGWPEAFAFVNFYSTGLGETFDRIEFRQAIANGGWQESDNHTIGTYLTIGGVTLVPEASSVALMIIGLAGIGAASRRRRLA